MQALHHSVALKRELSGKANLSVFKLTFVAILIYVHGSRIMTKRIRSQMNEVLVKMKGIMMFNKPHNTEIRESLNNEPLLLRIKRSQLRWIGHESRMPQERLPKQTFYAKENDKKPVAGPRTRWLLISCILVEAVWDFVRAKCSLLCLTEKCGGLI